MVDTKKILQVLTAIAALALAACDGSDTSPGGATLQAAALAPDSEFQNLGNVVSSMMIDNNLITIPNPVSSNTFPCTTGTQDMSAFPDSTSVGGSADKPSDPGGTAYDASDKAGFLLYTHDIAADGDDTTTVNYLTTGTSTFCYTVVSDGSVTQYDIDGTQLNP